MISICMATYNGSIYIERQLRSILCQIAATDEVILVDDHSTDATLGIVSAMGDQRIKVYRNQSNQGDSSNIWTGYKPGFRGGHISKWPGRYMAPGKGSQIPGGL